jgi:hypothetical protein
MALFSHPSDPSHSGLPPPPVRLPRTRWAAADENETTLSCGRRGLTDGTTRITLRP